jgi:predicted dehydrogenase
MGQEGRVNFGVVGINPRIRRSIIGGIVASRHGRLAAVCSRDRSKAEQLAAEHHCAAYSSYEAMLADPVVDAVIVETPHHLHSPMTVAAIQAGKRVVCEKPLALNGDEAAAMVRAAQTSGQPGVVNFTYHSMAGHRFIARLLAESAVGRLRYLDLSYWQARQGLPGVIANDALFEVGSHVVDLLLWWAKAGEAGQIVEVAAQAEDAPAGQARVFGALARTVTGALATLQLNRASAGWRNGMVCRLVGEAGTVTLEFDTDRTVVTLARYGDGSDEGTTRQLPIPGDLVVSFQDFPAHHLDRIALTLLGNGDMPGFEHGLSVQRVLDGLRLASTDHRWVNLVGSVEGT